MPELPEVERVRRSLEPHVVGRRVEAVELRRTDVVEGDPSPEALLVGQRITRIDRLGKQLALVGDDGRVACIHLGMTGSLRHHPPGPSPDRPTSGDTSHAPHTHVVWTLSGSFGGSGGSGGDTGGMIAFRDPRRFGGVWTFPDESALRAARWSALGEDALTIPPRRLHAGLSRRRTALKAALLDQSLLAGLGNIYVDELLFACGLSPLRPACTLGPDEVRRLVGRMRTLLARAIDAGGSTLRDYVDGEGRTGGFQDRHRVYGRAGLPCRRCRTLLASLPIAGRTTVHCPRCQPAEAGPASRGARPGRGRVGAISSEDERRELSSSP